MLTKTNYRKNYQNKSFKGQDLSNADFSSCDIRGADFTNANLTGANFTNATAGLGDKQAKIVWAIAIVILIVACFGGGLATHYLIRFISLKSRENISFSLGFVFLVSLLFCELIFLRMVKRQGIQKILRNVLIFLAFAIPLLVIFSSIGGKHHEFFKWFRSFRISSFTMSISKDRKSTRLNSSHT